MFISDTFKFVRLVSNVIFARKYVHGIPTHFKDAQSDYGKVLSEMQTFFNTPNPTIFAKVS
jgi:hypothetical protein